MSEIGSYPTFMNISLGPTHDFEIDVDANGAISLAITDGTYRAYDGREDHRCAALDIPADLAPDFVVALQAWLDQLPKGATR